MQELRSTLLVETPGHSIAYLTDFVMGKPVGKKRVPIIREASELCAKASTATGTSTWLAPILT